MLPALAFLSNRCRGYEATAWGDHYALIANLIGLLSQTCEATAGVIGNNIVALRRRTELFEEVQPPTLGAELVAEVARHYSPVRNPGARCEAMHDWL